MVYSTFELPVLAFYTTKNSVALRDGFRRNSGEFITFSPGKSGLKMAIDNVKIKSYVIDGDIKVSNF